MALLVWVEVQAEVVTTTIKYTEAPNHAHKAHQVLVENVENSQEIAMLLIQLSQPLQSQSKNQAQTVTAADRAARFGTTSKSEIYAQMNKNRVVEREQAIKDGLIPVPNALHSV
ncbi:hypothetical protein G6F43_011323 [Rhizopus delemar]|nr:hypothetical protein G6F43_011323 [Rhizopus delemar]